MSATHSLLGLSAVNSLFNIFSDANKVVIIFSVHPQFAGVQVCNTSLIRYYDMDNNPISFVVVPQTTDQLSENSCIVPNSGARIAIAKTTSAKTSVKVRPNPFAENLYIQVELLKDELVLVRLTDLNGRIVYTKPERLSAGVNNLNINLKKDLPRGIYILEVLAGNKRLSQQKLEKL